MLVITGSFDVFHKGHKSLISQVDVISKSIGEEMFHILIMEDHPVKDYLFSPQARHDIVDSWVAGEQISARVSLAKCTNERAADEAFFQAVGLPVTDKSVIIINGVKESDMGRLYSEMISFGYNKKLDGKKKLFLLSNEEGDFWQSSTNIKKYLAEKSDNSKEYGVRIKYLEQIGVIDAKQGQYFEEYRERIYQKNLEGRLLSDNSIQFPVGGDVK